MSENLELFAPKKTPAQLAEERREFLKADLTRFGVHHAPLRAMLIGKNGKLKGRHFEEVVA